MNTIVMFIIGKQKHLTEQGAEDKIEMTQNQVYGAKETTGDSDIIMKANIVYGVNEGSSQGNPNPSDAVDDSYDYIWLLQLAH